jgi:protein-L-isoaspartate(D-aspartate) O-methyltransferase
MDEELRLKICREAYAVQMLAKAGAEADERLRRAFATVRREAFLGPPPWAMRSADGYLPVLGRDPAVVYQDVLFALQADRGVNNGSPALHAGAIHALGISEGDVVAHIGAGSGYYTAILAEMTGPAGRVTAVEYDEDLARIAAGNLEHYCGVTVVNGDGWQWPKEDADVVYVNFAAPRPSSPWIDRLKPGGRLIFPLGVVAEDRLGRPLGYAAQSAFLLVCRQAEGFSARFLGPTNFVWSEGGMAAGAENRRRLEDAFRTVGPRWVESLRWKTPSRGGEWYSEEDWGLGYK